MSAYEDEVESILDIDAADQETTPGTEDSIPADTVEADAGDATGVVQDAEAETGEQPEVADRPAPAEGGEPSEPSESASGDESPAGVDGDPEEADA